MQALKEHLINNAIDKRIDAESFNETLTFGKYFWTQC